MLPIEQVYPKTAFTPGRRPALLLSHSEGLEAGSKPVQ
jgi:hypothetical protein